MIFIFCVYYQFLVIIYERNYGAYVIVRNTGDALDGDRDALREAGGIGLLGDRVQRLDVGRGPDQVGEVTVETPFSR
jgi:hypothetical protein